MGAFEYLKTNSINSNKEELYSTLIAAATPFPQNLACVAVIFAFFVSAPKEAAVARTEPGPQPPVSQHSVLVVPSNPTFHTTEAFFDATATPNSEPPHNQTVLHSTIDAPQQQLVSVEHVASQSGISTIQDATGTQILVRAPLNLMLAGEVGSSSGQQQHEVLVSAATAEQQQHQADIITALPAISSADGADTSQLSQQQQQQQTLPALYTAYATSLTFPDQQQQTQQLLYPGQIYMNQWSSKTSQWFQLSSVFKGFM